MRSDRKVRLQWERGWNAGGRWVIHRRIVGPLLLLLVLPLVPEAWGTDRYVSKSGVNNPACTQAAPCSSIQQAVNVAGLGDTISIGKGKFQECVIIDEGLTLNGAGIFSTRVVGSLGCSSIFKVESGVDVTITDLDVMYGKAEQGGGIWNGGSLTLERVRVWKNHATYGGGIFNTGALRIYSSEIARNSASGSGGGLYNKNFAELTEVRIVVNYADPGKSGGIENRGTPLAFPLVNTMRSEISHNSGHGIGNWGNMSLINTTVSRNKQSGIFVADGFDTELVHVTVAENGGGGLHVQGGTASSIVLINTIVANNTPVQCIFPPSPFSPSSTNSLSSDMTCNLSPGSIAPVDPKLGPLKWNGGLTFTHALKSGSPAIDAGSPDYCESDDQRGVLRQFDGNGDGTVNCDIGAFEYKSKALRKPPLEQ